MSRADDYLAKIKVEKLNAFRFVPDEPLTIGDGELSDVSFAVKDNILIKDWPAGAASKILEGFVAPYDATVIRRLKKAGAVFVGRTNMDEFAMGGSTENSAYGVVKNPWGQSTVPGGSSGGSAAAVAADLCDVALGSDTGGSIRQPAAFCGITGLKPTYGSVSRYGLIALASSLDVIGPLARSAEEVEKVFAVISGKDYLDQTTIDYTYAPTEIDFSTLKIGLPKEWWDLEIDPEINTVIRTFLDWLKKKGAQTVELSMPTLPFALAAYYIILPAEVSANLSRFDGIRYQKSVIGAKLIDQYKNTRALFGPEVKRRVLLGTFALSVGHYDDYYEQAVKVKSQITREYKKVFEQVDVILGATTPTLPFKIGENAQDPLAMYQSDLLTVSANLAGVPAISLPIGFSQSGMPIGGQITAAHKNENIILALAKAYQKETDWHTRKPKEIDE